MLTKNDIYLGNPRLKKANVKLDLGTDGSYTVILVQNGVSRVVKINGGSSNVITIRQES